MKKIERLISSLLIIVLFLPIAACASGLSAAPTAAPTQEVTAAPVLKQTPSPVPTPVPTLSPEEEKEVLNQQFHDISNKEGEFTEAKLEVLPIYPHSRNAGDKVYLGILDVFDSGMADDYCINVYGYFFESYKNESNNIV
jgi:hypothetical protein